MQILNNKGQGLTEYLILLLLISVVSIGATKALGGAVKQKLKDAKTQINKEMNVNELVKDEGGSSASGGGGSDLSGSAASAIGSLFGLGN